MHSILIRRVSYTFSKYLIYTEERVLKEHALRMPFSPLAMNLVVHWSEVHKWRYSPISWTKKINDARFRLFGNLWIKILYESNCIYFEKCKSDLRFLIFDFVCTGLSFPTFFGVKNNNFFFKKHAWYIFRISCWGVRPL